MTADTQLAVLQISFLLPQDPNPQDGATHIQDEFPSSVKPFNEQPHRHSHWVSPRGFEAVSRVASTLPKLPAKPFLSVAQ